MNKQAAKRGNSIVDRLKAWKEFYEDLNECRPELLPDFLYDRHEENGKCAALERATAYFKLDPKADAQVLLVILANVVFPATGRERGRMSWGIERLKRLGAHYDEVALANPGGISDNWAAKEIKKRHPKQYATADAIRSHLMDARLMTRSRRDTPEQRAIKDRIGNEIYLRLMLHTLRDLPRAKRRVFLRGLPLRFDKIKSAESELKGLGLFNRQPEK
jgi:hypothetical protein